MEGSEEEIMLKIDGIEVNAKEGTSIYEVAKTVDITIPTLCHSPALEPFCACRICSVEITDKRGRKKIVTSCNYPVSNGLVVDTKSEKVMRNRKLLLELLLARCPNAKTIQKLALEYGIEKPRYWVGDPEEERLVKRLRKEKQD